MKLILEPSAPDAKFRSQDCAHLRIEIEHPSDDLAIDTVVDMVRGLLLAAGYAPRTVDGALASDEGGRPLRGEPE